jgi:hypothetical protein
MQEVQVGNMYSVDPCLVRENHINSVVLTNPTVYLPEGAFNQDSSYDSVISAALAEGAIDHNWMVTAYARTTKAPVQAVHFVAGQFARFGLEAPPHNFVTDVFKFLVYHIDYNHPELFFNGLTEVSLSNDKFYYTYRLCTSFGGAPEVTPIETFDVYKRFPVCVQNFHWLMNHPGLTRDSSEHRPFELVMLWDMLEEASESHDFDQHFGEHWMEYFGYGQKYRDVVHLAVWACLMWMIKPDEDSAAWRADVMPVFHHVREHGECVFSSGDYYIPGEFQKLERPVGTCCVCGVKLPCCQIYKDDNPEVEHYSEYYCSKHAVDTEPYHFGYYGRQLEFACSSCEFTECPHNNATKLVIAPRGRGQILRNNLKKIQQGTLVANSDVIDV